MPQQNGARNCLGLPASHQRTVRGHVLAAISEIKLAQFDRAIDRLSDLLPRLVDALGRNEDEADPTMNLSVASLHRLLALVYLGGFHTEKNTQESQRKSNAKFKHHHTAAFAIFKSVHPPSHPKALVLARIRDEVKQIPGPATVSQSPLSETHQYQSLFRRAFKEFASHF